MSNFINGWQHPIFKIISTDGESPSKSISLPLTTGDGLIEKVEEKIIQHELYDFSFEDEVLGYRITWTLPYTEYANKTTMLLIQDILKYRKQGWRIFLIPRSDLPNRIFEVVYTGTELNYGIKKGGSHSVGNKGAEIVWTTKYLVDDLGWEDPDLIPHPAFYLYSRLGVYQLT